MPRLRERRKPTQDVRGDQLYGPTKEEKLGSVQCHVLCCNKSEYEADKKGKRENGTPEAGKYGMLCLPLLSDLAREGGRGNKSREAKKPLKNIGQQGYQNSQRGGLS